jgi:ribosomal protein S18 acetylase RimI-like enzyme
MVQDLGEPKARSDVYVRTSVVGDDRALAAVVHSAWTWTVGPVPLSPRERAFFNDQTRPENVFVAQHFDQVVGYVKLRPAAMAASCGHVQQVHGFAVDPTAQGLGIGRQLLDAARQEAIRRGARRITLRVLGTNIRAQKLYLACGYRVEGVLKGEFLLQGVYVDDVFMALDLTEERHGPAVSRTDASAPVRRVPEASPADDGAAEGEEGLVDVGADLPADA